jgi:hypothetical protein
MLLAKRHDRGQRAYSSKGRPTTPKPASAGRGHSETHRSASVGCERTEDDAGILDEPVDLR